MARSVKKGPFVDGHLAKRSKWPSQKMTKNRSRLGRAALPLRPDFVGLNDRRSQRQAHVPVYVSDQMVGHKLGEFALTRVFKGTRPTKVAKK